MAVSTTISVSKKDEQEKKIKWPEDWGKLTKVYVPTDDGDESPMCGSINGTNWKIPRNEWVEVPQAVADIIDQTDKVIRESAKRNKEFEEGKLDLT